MSLDVIINNRKKDTCIENVSSEIANGLISAIIGLKSVVYIVNSFMTNNDIYTYINRMRIRYRNTGIMYYAFRAYKELYKFLMDRDRINEFIKPITDCSARPKLEECFISNGIDLSLLTENVVNTTSLRALYKARKQVADVLSYRYVKERFGITGEITDRITTEICNSITNTIG